MGQQQLAGVALLVLLAMAAAVGGGGAAAAALEGVEYRKLPSDAPCYTGVAELRKIADECQDAYRPLAPLSTPFDATMHLPWDCLNRMLVSVESCQVSMVSLVNASQLLEDWSCSWLAIQGSVSSGSAARVAPWVRPSAAARYILRHTDLDAASAAPNAPRRPAGWQERLHEALGDRGSLLLGVEDRFVVLRQSVRSCNTTFEVVSGGLLGVGSVDRKSVGAVVVPAGRPFEGPVVLRGERPRWWVGRARAMMAALFTLVALFGLLLLAALGLLAYRLCAARRHKDASGMPPLQGSPFDDGLPQHLGGAGSAGGGGSGVTDAHHHQQHVVGVGSLEHSARRLGTSGGL